MRTLEHYLPPKALKQLQESTPLWINKSLTYGPKDSPIIARHACFHPHDGQEWLRKQGLSEDKAGGIELYTAKDYVEGRQEWGDGGLLLHELSHAYHNKFCRDGFDNRDIREVRLQNSRHINYSIVCRQAADIVLVLYI